MGTGESAPGAASGATGPRTWRDAGAADCDGAIRNNLIAWNSAGGVAGGLYDCDGLIENNVIYGNKGYDLYVFDFIPGPGGVYSCSGVLKNNIIWNNTPATQGQIGRSTAPVYCCVEGYGGSGTGTLNLDPRFVDPEAMDFRLLPDSPCIDAGGAVDGKAYPDFLGRSRPVDAAATPRGDGSDIDIGIIEYIDEDFILGIEAHLLGRTGVEVEGLDVNGDGRIDVGDVVGF